MHSRPQHGSGVTVFALVSHNCCYSFFHILIPPFLQGAQGGERGHCKAGEAKREPLAQGHPQTLCG